MTKSYSRPVFIADGQDRLTCPVPLKISTYRGCEGNCLYCSMNNSQSARWRVRSEIAPHEIAPSPIRYIEKMFYSSGDSMEKTLIEQRYPAQLGHSSDPLQPAEKKYHITYKCLEILKSHDYPTIITTKFPTLLTELKYLRIIDGLPLVVQCSMSTENQALLSTLEPNAPSMRRRIAALKTLSDFGATIQLRLWPFIPDLCGNLEVLLSAAYDAGVRTVQANFLKMFNAGRDASRFRSALGYDYAKESCLGYEQRHNFKIPNLITQRQEIMQLETLCQEIGLEVLTCDDLTGSRNWRACCGIDGLPGFKPAPWAYYVNGHKITNHTSYEEYMSGIDCPWSKEFEMEWGRGRLAKAVPDLVFHADDMTYSRCS